MDLIQSVESPKRKEWHLRKRTTFPSQMQHRNFTWVSILQTQSFRQYQLVGFSSLLAYPLDLRLDNPHISRFLEISLSFSVCLAPSLPLSVYIYMHTCIPTYTHIYIIYIYIILVLFWLPWRRLTHTKNKNTYFNGIKIHIKWGNSCKNT